MKAPFELRVRIILPTDIGATDSDIASIRDAAQEAIMNMSTHDIISKLKPVNIE